MFQKQIAVHSWWPPCVVPRLCLTPLLTGPGTPLALGFTGSARGTTQPQGRAESQLVSSHLILKNMVVKGCFSSARHQGHGHFDRSDGELGVGPRKSDPVVSLR